MIFLTALAAFSISLIVLLLLLHTPLRRLAMDNPNARSLHVNPIPRTGGLAIMIAVLILWFYFGVSWLWPSLLTLLLFISLLDDIFNLSVKWRLLIQLVLCAVFVLYGMQPLSWWFVIGAVLALVWMVNLYNFMDGSDGLSGGMAAFGFGGYAIAAFLAGDQQLALLSSCVVGASLAFLWFNFHPAKIFMGDGGSVPLGFLAGSIGLYGWQSNSWPLWLPVLIFSPFIIDASVTLVRRLVRGEKVWQAHRSHYYQRLVRAGWGHKNTAIAEYGVMFVAVASSIWMLKHPDFIAVGLCAWGMLYIFLMALVDNYWERSQR